MHWTFVETLFFSRRRDSLFGNDEEYREFQESLMKNPRQGAPLGGGSGVRKTRWLGTTRGKGKRGGLRVIYLHVPETHELYLLHVYPKGTQDNLTKDEIRHFGALAKGIRVPAIARRRRER